MNKTWLPLCIGVVCAAMLYVGIRIGQGQAVAAVPRYESESKDFNSSRSSGMSSTEASAKLVYLFDLLRDKYVDTLDLKKLVEDALPTIVNELDPHSVYIPATDLDDVKGQLEGSFSGVGIQFNIQQDTVMVIQVISGGPSEKAGLMPGDRIVEVDDSIFCGKGISNDKVMKTLRGPKGSQVKLGVLRHTSAELLTYEIVRGDIPVNSVVARFLDEEIGYIKIDNFGRNTYNEFFTSLVELKARGAKAYVLDFRGNGGGYMEVCCQMVNEFLDKGNLIVYTEGKAISRSDINADGHGNFRNDPVIVLIDEWSASASEIFSGAIQDNDRGLVVGRRSFGKGLVQQQFDLYDGSALRLTIARYHTPSGRYIQKPYEMGQGKDYQMDILNRFDRGEFYSADSIHLNDSLIFHTAGGRQVYGGGGIMPDIFVPSDTSYVTKYYNRCINMGLCYSFSFQFSDRHRDELAAYSDYETLQRYLMSQNLMNRFVKFAAEKAGTPSDADLKKSGASLERLIIAYIMRQCKDENYFYRQFNSEDPAYLKAIELIKAGRATPQI